MREPLRGAPRIDSSKIGSMGLILSKYILLMASQASSVARTSAPRSDTMNCCVNKANDSRSSAVTVSPVPAFRTLPVEEDATWLVMVFRSLTDLGLVGREPLLPSIHIPGLVITSLSGEMMMALLDNVASTKIPSGFSSPIKGAALSEASGSFMDVPGLALCECPCSWIRRSWEAATEASASRDACLSVGLIGLSREREMALGDSVEALDRGARAGVIDNDGAS